MLPDKKKIYIYDCIIMSEEHLFVKEYLLKFNVKLIVKYPVHGDCLRPHLALILIFGIKFKVGNEKICP